MIWLTTVALGAVIQVGTLHTPTVADALAIAADGDTIELTDPTWTERVNLSGRTLTLSCTATTWSGPGPLVQANTGDITIDGCDFAPRGNAVFVQDGSLTVRNASFATNTSIFGAAISALRTDIDVQDTSFSGRGGSAIYVEDGTAFLSGLSADDLLGQRGSVIYGVDSDVSLQDSVLRYADAMDGGLMAVSGGSLTITNATLGDASAVNNGGCLWTYGAAVWLEDTVLEHCDATNGGGIWSAGGGWTALRTRFQGNTATDGGGMHLIQATSTSRASIWLENTATRGGGAWLDRGSASIQHGLFAGNHGPTGAHLNTSSTVVILRSTGFTLGDGIDLVSTSTVWDIAWSGFYNAPALTFVGLGSPVGLLGNLGGDPEIRGLHVDGVLDDDLCLRASSPWIDAGDPTELDSDGSRADIGPFGGPDFTATDADADGWWSHLDCDDTDPTISPAETEIPYDNVDEDCSGVADVDLDGDGHDGLPAGGDDCDDTDPLVNPNAAEIGHDGIDQDCDGLDIVDADRDGFEAGVDCNDADPGTYPGAPDAPYDGVDSDCQGDDDFDADKDGFASDRFGGTDCDDTHPYVMPGGVDHPYDGIDQDCSGSDANDLDGDGWPSLRDGLGPDCDDTSADVHPDAVEIWYDGIDQNCDGNDADQDGDGFSAEDAGGRDCHDQEPAIHPAADEVWYDGVDQDCDGAHDHDADQDGYLVDEDCDDTRNNAHPDAEEVRNGLDDDCDGFDETVDRDHDGLADWEEDRLGTDRWAADSDQDGRPDGMEIPDSSDPPDHDLNASHDALDDDDDGDGIPTREEDTFDVDGDGVPDWDVDGDGIDNAHDVNSDGDAWTDAEEYGLDAEGDGIPDYLQAHDEVGGGGGCQGGSQSGGLLFLALLLLRPAKAEDADMRNLEMLSMRPNASNLRLAEPNTESGYGFALAYDFAWKPLVAQSNGTPVDIVSQLHTGTVHLDLRPHWRVAIDASMGVAGGVRDGGFAGPIDLRAGVGITAWRPNGFFPGLSFHGYMWAPTGSGQDNLGLGRWSGGGLASFRQELGPVGITLNAGGRYARPEVTPLITTGTGPMMGAGVDVRAGRGFVAAVEWTAQGSSGWQWPWPMELSLNLRMRTKANIYVMVGGAYGLNGQLGVPQARAWLTFGWASVHKEKTREVTPPPPPGDLPEVPDPPVTPSAVDMKPELAADADVPEEELVEIQETGILPVMFDPNNADISHQDRQRLQAIAHGPSGFIILTGHVAHGEEHEVLSECRSHAVAHILTDGGVSSERIYTVHEDPHTREAVRHVHVERVEELPDGAVLFEDHPATFHKEVSPDEAMR